VLTTLSYPEKVKAVRIRPTHESQALPNSR
jgi:hypothetical protein